MRHRISLPLLTSALGLAEIFATRAHAWHGVNPPTLARALSSGGCYSPPRTRLFAMPGDGNTPGGGERQEHLEGLTVVQLKSMLRARGLPVSGRKAELVARLREGPGDPAQRSRAPAGAGGPASSRRRSAVKKDREQKRARPGRSSRVEFTRDPTPRRPDSDLPRGSFRRLCVASWNVAGLRGLLRKDEGRAALRNLVAETGADVVCLMETKLQDMHVADVEADFRSALGDADDWSCFWACSGPPARKGYSGVAIAVRTAAWGVSEPAYGMGDETADREGRTVSVTVGGVAIVASYVPNSGEGLRRLTYRCESWEPAMTAFLRQQQEGGQGRRPVLYVGDLNVAHEDIDFFNPEEKRMEKQAGTTPLERSRFGDLLEGAGLVDPFRERHPDARGCYTYWSMRAGNRPWNRGLRLDYTLGSRSLRPITFDGPVTDEEWRTHDGAMCFDTYIAHDCMGSDHAPVVVDILVKP